MHAGIPVDRMARKESARTSPDQIADEIVNAIMSGRLTPGQRLGEQSLADLFGVSRTLVREALSRLSARGMVQVHAGRGWVVVEPSRDEAHEAFDARIAIETGMLQSLSAPLGKPALARLKKHVREEKAAIAAGEPARRSYLLGDFHVCLADCAGNALLAGILRDLTARTTLIASLFQSDHDAAESCADHAQIVVALEAGNVALAVRRLREHIEAVRTHLGAPSEGRDPLSALRSALQPPAGATLFTELISSPPTPSRAKRKRPQENPA
jgi:DNA-binding GntR family transcriptional regulator